RARTGRTRVFVNSRMNCRKPPALAHETAKRARTRGVLLFAYSSLGQARESRSLARRDRESNWIETTDSRKRNKEAEASLFHFTPDESRRLTARLRAIRRQTADQVADARLHDLLRLLLRVQRGEVDLLAEAAAQRALVADIV